MSGGLLLIGQWFSGFWLVLVVLIADVLVLISFSGRLSVARRSMVCLRAGL